MSSITKIKVADTTYDIKDNISGYITKDVDDLINYYDKEQVDYNIEQVSEDIPTRTSQLTNDSGFVGTAALAGKQDTLISGSNIKTINGSNILGSGNLVVESQGEINLVDDVQLNGTSIVNDKIANIHVVDNYGNNNPLTTQQNLQDVHDELDAKLPYTMLDFNETTNHIKTVEGTDLPVAYTKVDGNYKQETTTGKNLFDVSKTLIGGVTGGIIVPTIKNRFASENIEVEPNTEYTFMASNIFDFVGFRIGVHELNNDTFLQDNQWHQLTNNNGFVKYTFTTTSETNNIKFVGSFSKTNTNVQTDTTENKDALNLDEIKNGLKLQLELGSTATEYEPYTGGQPSPSPDYPQEIEVIEDSIDIKVIGKNLFDKNNAILHQYNASGTEVYDRYALDEDGNITISYTNATYGRTFFNKIQLDAGNYIISFVAKTSGTSKEVWRSVRNMDTLTDIVTNSKITITDGGTYSVRFSLSETTNVGISINPHNTDTGILTISNIQIEKGSTITTYEPYKSTIKTIDLQDEFIGKLPNGIKDEVHIDKYGNVSLVKNIRYLQLAIADMDNGENYPGWKGQTQLGIDYPGVNTTFANAGIHALSNISNSRLKFSLNTTIDSHPIWLNRTYWGNEKTQTWWETNYPDLIFKLYYGLATPYIVNLGNIGSIDMFVGTNNILVSTNIDTNYNIRIYNKSGLIPTLTSQLINDSGFITQSGLSDYALATEAANTMTMEVNTDYVLTSKLKDKNGSVIDTATVDLPIEGLVMNGRYDTATKKIVLTLKNGNTIEFSIADLISDRQLLIDSTHKLDSDLINTTGQTNQFVLASDKETWNAKQNPIIAGTGITLTGSRVEVSNYNNILSSINSKQDLLTSGVNIKTINNQSLLGSGNINIQGGGSEGTSTDVQINGTSITANDIANIAVWGDYNPTTNPLVTVEKIAFREVNVFPEVRDLTIDSTSADIIEAFGGIDMLEMVIEAIENPDIHLVTTVWVPVSGGSEATYLDITKKECHENHWELGATGHGFDWYLAFEKNDNTYSVVRAYNRPLVAQSIYEDYGYNRASFEIHKDLVYVKTGNTIQLFGETEKIAGSAAAYFTNVPNGWAPARSFYYQYTEVNIPGGETYRSNPVEIDSWGNLWIKVSSSASWPATGIFDGFTYIIAPYSEEHSDPACFAGDTKVYGEKEKIISELQIGDKVYAYDHKADHKVLTKVLNIVEHNEITKIVEITCGENKIICTPEHAIFAIERPYASAREMREGFHIFNAEQELVEITKIEVKEINTITGYDIDTEYHNYFVGDNKLLVHTEHITMDHE